MTLVPRLVSSIATSVSAAICGSAVLLSLLLASCATDSSSGTVSRDNAPPGSYMRIERPNADTIALQIAVREFRSKQKHQPRVWLVGASHIGESNYFARLQTLLDSHRLVLFEGVGARSKQMKFDPEEGSSIQHTLATSLGMVFQLAAIDYDRSHFRNSDLTLARIQELLSGSHGTEGGRRSGASQEFQQLLQAMDGSSFLGTLLHVGLKFLGSNPKLQAMTKVVLIETLGQLQGDLSELKGMPPEIQQLLAVIIRERNKVVMEDLRTELPRVASPGAIAIFYGAGHMADLERRLRGELGFQPRREIWLTAMSVDTRAAGLSQTELEAMRGLVKWQMEALGQTTP